MSFSAFDFEFMAHALKLAERGLNTTMPNPRVGCVIAKDGQIIGEGAHLKAGEPHAEIYALKQAGEQAEGATVYVTLEPCNHHGRTPPCSEALFQAGVGRVIAAMKDPNPIVSGTGLEFLKSRGIATEVGLMETQARELNPGFISRMTKKLPFVRSKIAVSLDGKTALRNGISQWITCEASRRDVQHWRARSCVILTGAGTVLADNPRLTVRDMDISRQPLRVVVDTALKIPLEAAILQGGNCLVAYVSDSQNKAQALQDMGVQLVCLPDAHGKVCLKSLMNHLADIEVNEVMVEGGAGLNGALLRERLVDELLIYQAPILLGHQAQGMFDFAELTTMQDKIQLQTIESRQFGVDTRIRTKPLFAG